MKKNMWLHLFTGSFFLFASTASAEPLNDAAPFAERHVILQVSDADPVRHSLVIDIANNLGKHYGGADVVDIEVITFGTGVRMLFASSPLEARIRSLQAQGVRFYVCGNTLDTIERRDGKRPALIRDVETVQTGVAFLVDEINRGYTPVHP